VRQHENRTYENSDTSRTWRRSSGSRVAGALGAVLLVGSALLSSSPVGAQTAGQAGQRTATTNAAPLNNINFNVVRPAFATYYQQHGGVRTFGTPLSNDFQLLGLRVQILQNQVLQQHPDGSITAMDLLNKALPLARADGYTYPAADPDMSAAVPPLTSPTYVDDALSSIDSGWFDEQVPDSWNDLPINFNTAFRSTFRSAITCDDLPAGMPCDDRSLLRGALDVWGLPISLVTADPNDPSHVYQRFQRGIMHYSAYDGSTSAIPVGDYFRRVLQDQSIPDDLRADLTGSRFLGEYAPSQPLGVARPLDLPATSLTAAFTSAGSDTSSTTTTTTTSAFDASASGATGVTSATGASGVTSAPGATTVGTPSSTSPFGGALPGFNQTTDPSLVSGTPTPSLPSTTGTTVAVGTPVAASTPSPTAAPAGPDPCAGDEQIMFSPNKPYANTDVLVSVTSARHHNSSTVRLTGPVKPGAVTERQGLNGWVWEWTVSPSVEGWYEFSFFTDGARKCATSGFNVLPAFGTTATPTVAPIATLAPVTSATVTPTPTVGAPSISGTNPPSGGACQGSVLQLTGSNFGATQSELQGQVIMNIPGGSRAATVLGWASNSIMVTLPTPLAAGDYQLFVFTTSGTSAPLTYKVGAC
jgi:hypothetical protein